jgi:RNA polymerase sigma factor (sigma-70 family)
VPTSQPIEDVLPGLCEQLRGQVRYLFYKHQIPPQDAEDLLQTALLIAVSKWPEIHAPHGWLLATLQKRCIRYWRDRRAYEQRYVQLEDWAKEPATHPAQERRDLLADLEKAGRRLSVANRRLLALRFRQGLSTGEAASAMGLAENSIRKTTNRALAQLRVLVGTEPVAPSASTPRLRSPALADLLRLGGRAGAAWMAAVDAFVAASGRQSPGRKALARELVRAGARLGFPPLVELTAEALAAYRGGAKGGAVPCIAELYSLRSFLQWAGTRGEHHLEARVIDKTLGFAGRCQRRVPPSTHPADAAWLATIDQYLAARSFSSSTQHQVRQHLIEMTRASSMASKPLAGIAASDLVAYRAELLKDGRAAGTHVVVLTAVRGFLLWARAQGTLAVDAEVIRGTLRGWKAQARRRRGAPPIAGAARCGVAGDG